MQGYHVQTIWRDIRSVLEARKPSFTTGVLNRILSRVRDRLQPPIRQGRRLKIYYATQKLDAPIPTFMLFINQKKLWVESYGRYLMNQLREERPMTGCPIVFELREHAGHEDRVVDLQTQTGRLSRYTVRKVGKRREDAGTPTRRFRK